MGTICITDDSSTTRASVEYTLTEANYNVLSSIDGEDCLNKLNCDQPDVDLFIFDVNMPKMDGITLVKEVRKLEKFKFTPILMLTTESQDSIKMEGKKAGASGWLVKPFNPDQLVSIVKRFVPS
jgi:two-component system chemotaxis response regulator CheY